MIPNLPSPIVYVGSAGTADQLFTFDLTSRVTRQLTSLSGNAGFPVWSPDGMRMVFVVATDESADVVIRDAESGATTVIVRRQRQPGRLGTTW